MMLEELKFTTVKFTIAKYARASLGDPYEFGLISSIGPAEGAIQKLIPNSE